MCDSERNGSEVLMKINICPSDGLRISTVKGPHMTTLAWIGIIVWGLVITAFGLVSAGPAPADGAELQPHDVIFLLAGGLVTCLIGVTGLMGFMGWVPGLRKQQKNII
jgi:hypothetical protein